MNFVEYLEYLLGIKVEYRKYMMFPPIFFADCICGDISSLIKDLDKLIEKPIKEFTKRDWEGIKYIFLKIKGGK